VPQHGFRCGSESLTRHGGVAAHHPPTLTGAQGHHNFPGEAGVQRHGRAMMPQVTEVKVTEAAARAALRNRRLMRTRL
jgi:hypothetical protein